MAGVACPAYPWPQDASQRGPKVFMQSDCAACHSMLHHAPLREAAPHGDVVAQAAEIVVVEAQPAAAPRPLRGGTPDLATLATKDGLRCNLYSTGGATVAAAVCQELKTKMAPPSSVRLRFAQPSLRAFQAA
ncbi:unnamed protein product [Alopecurus aequalis]